MTVEDPVAPPASAAAVSHRESAVVPPNPDYPVRLDVSYVAHRSRGSLFFPRLRAFRYWVEHLLMLFVVLFSWYANTFSILFTGKYRQGSFETFQRFLRVRWTWLVYTRRLVSAPPHLEDTDYPARIELPQQLPTVSSRLRPLYVGWLCFGQALLAWWSYSVSICVYFYAYWVTLITGKYPAAAFRYQVVTLRRLLRLQAFYFLMTEERLPGNA
jgi:hypothetical protein